MLRNEFDVLNLIRKVPNISINDISKETDLSISNINYVYDTLLKNKLIKDGRISKKGLDELEPYKVKAAIIMAAGISLRFAPISFETPKGLLVVRDEVLIERQISQLVKTGIKNIIIVLGYKSHLFLYLKDKFPFIKIIINKYFNTKNNIESLYIAKKYLSNAYICSCDDYFTINPFDKYVYESYYAGHYAKEKTDEFYMVLDSNKYIKRIYIGGSKANIMFGHAYFDNNFAQAFIGLMNIHRKKRDYDQKLWDVLLMHNLKNLPKMFGKLYPYGVINEFDSLEDLRKFDSKYIKHTGCKIIENICKRLNCKESEVYNFEILRKNNDKVKVSFQFKKNKYCFVKSVSDDDINFLRLRKY